MDRNVEENGRNKRGIGKIGPDRARGECYVD
jgi:hypothetical protein